jgi:hypothetical protein
MFGHLCLACFSREVVGEFSDVNGEGFCSVECFTIANEEFANHFEEVITEDAIDDEPQFV